MNLQRIEGKPFYFNCCRCGKQTLSSDEGEADLDGVPFRAWYCAACAAVRRAERMAADIVQGPIVGVPA